MCSSSLNFSMPSTTYISNYVSTKLWFKYPENNYQVWKEQMRCMLDGHGLLGFIDGCALPPINGDKPAQVMSRDWMMWRRSDALVKGWILSACSDDVVSGVANLETAKDVWLELGRMSYQLSIDPSALLANGCEWGRYWPLQQAVIQGDWDKTTQIFSNDVEAIKAGLDGFKSTALHIAVGTGEIEFFNKLVAVMPDETIAQQTENGDTALSIAAALGNKEAATVLVKRMPRLLYVSNNQMDFPVQIAAKYANRAVLDYLIFVTDCHLFGYDGQNPYAGSAGLRLLVYVIDAGFFDIAFDLVVKYPCLAKLKLPNNDSALKKLAEKKWAFSSRKELLGNVDRLILFVYRKSPEWLWKHVEILLPPQVSRFKDKQLPPNRAKELVVKLCNGLQYNLSQEKALEIYYDAILMATQSRATYVIEVIKETFPGAIYSSKDAHISIVHVAIQNRSLDILKLIYGNSCHRHLYSDWLDFEGNNLLHLAAKLTPALKIQTYPVAALQRELIWYEKVEALVHPGCTNQLNKAGKTPWMVFREEHLNMKVDAEKCMKDTYSSCLVVYALIATVTFAAAITVPGGTNDTSGGFPVFSKRLAFFIFAIADIISLCFSVNSILLFLEILTTPNTYESVLAYPWYLLNGGFGYLVISLFSMMVAFSAALFLVFRKHNIWIPILATWSGAYSVLTFLWSPSQLLSFARYRRYQYK